MTPCLSSLEFGVQVSFALEKNEKTEYDMLL